MTQHDLVERLRECPFCGGDAELVRKDLDERHGYGREASVKCKSCGNRTGPHYHDERRGYANRDTADPKAISAWNARLSSETPSCNENLQVQSDTEQLAALLWREGTYSGLWFGDRLVEASKILAAQSDLQRKLDMAVEALELFALLAGGDVNMNDPLRKWLTVAHLQQAAEVITAIKDTPTNG